MKRRQPESTAATGERVIAMFGRARLVRDWAGRYLLRGGSPADQSEAREWIALFLHEAVLWEG